MPNSGYAFGDQPALDEIAHTDLLLDTLAERERIDLDDPQVDALAVLMGDWRDDLRWPPASALVSPEEAVEALRTGMAERRRTHRGVAAIGSVAATLLMLSGFGALVADAHRGDPLYGLHVMFFDAPRVNDDTITLSAKADLAKIQQMIDQGQWAQAQNELAAVTSTVQAMNDSSSKQTLLDEVNLLNTRVESAKPQRDAAGSRDKTQGFRDTSQGFGDTCGVARFASGRRTPDGGRLDPCGSICTSAPGPPPAPRQGGALGHTKRRTLARVVSDAETRRRLDVASLSEASAYPRQ